MDAFSSKLKRLTGSFADPRLFQIFSLGILLAAGAYFRDFSIRPAQVVLTFAAGLLMQTACWTLTPSKPRSVRSAIITCLSLSLLLRADNLLAHPIAAAAAISSKSLFRFRDKHLFNPATFGVIFAIVFLPGTWVSPGQWGQDFAIAGWVLMLGMLVTNRARRGDISWTFLAFYLGALATRIEYLGQRWAVWTHQLESGALLLFAFFMISDPMTGPNDRRGRIAHAALVAALAYAWQIPALPHQRTHLGFVYRGAVRSAVGRDLARAQIRMDPKWRWPCSLNESRFSSSVMLAAADSRRAA